MGCEQLTSRHEYDSAMAKQRASVMWIVQKANKNKVPAEYQDPYYRDHENREHLKPGIVSQLANADLYCSALANIYGDPNFFSLSHWKVIQALARKGVYVAEPTDVALNETILLQDSPIKMSAHLAVIEAMMALYIREVVVAERVVTALHKITGGTGSNEPTPQDQEEALVLWVARVTSALQDRIAQQLSENNQELPQFPRIQDLSDLSDGIGLAALISYYCPQELHWGDIAVADPPSMSDSLYNIGLVIKFCHEALPYNPCLLTKEDIVYMHSCVKQNVLAFVTELFFLLELQPVSCVTPHNRRASATKYASPSGMKPAGAPSVRRSHSMTLNDVAAGGGDGTGVPGDRSLLSSRSRGSAMMLDSRSPQQHHHHHHQDHHSSSHSDYGGRESSMSDGQDGEFVVQRSRGVSTLNDMIRHNRPSAHDQRDDDTQSWYDGSRHGGRRGMDDDTQSRLSNEDDVQSFKMYRRDSQYGSIQDLQQTEKLPPAGMPSRFENRPQGRSRSRRNSISAEESQLTVENFGGSQDNLNEYISRKSEKEAVVHSGRKDSLDRTNRASMHQQQLDNRILDKLQREALEREKREFMFGSKNAIFAEDPPSYEPPPPPPADANNQDSGSESDLSSEREKLSKATSFAELGKIKEQLPQGGINIIYMQGDKPDKKNQQLKMNEKKSNAVGNQTTWKQQAPQNSQADDGKRVGDENMEPQLMASELHNVRMKLEEKRRRIEAEKRKMEQVLNKQRQKMGKEAFMQAVVKGDIGAEMSQVSRRWLAEGDGVDGGEVRTPDVEAMDYEQYHTSLTQMTDSLSELQGDIQRLNAQQQQIQGMLRNGQQPPHQQQQQQQFYLHDQSPGGGNSGGRRMWGDGGAMPAAGVAPDYSNSPVTRRAQWGPVRPVPGHVAPDFYQQQQGYYPPAPQPGYQQQLPPLHHHQQQGGGGGSFMLHGGQPHSMPAPPPHPHLQYSAQNGGGQYYPGQDHQSYKGPPPYSQQYQPPQDGRTPPNAAPFRLHSGDDDATNSSRGPSSLRSSVHNSPNRLPLQQQPPHYNTYSSPHQYPPNYSSPGQQYTPPSYGMQHHTPPPGHPNPAAAGPAPPQHHPHQSPAGRQSVSPARSIKHDGSNSMIHAPVAAPPPDDMEPQNVSFIDSSRNSQERESVQRTPNSRRSEVDSGADSPTTERLKRMSIGSGSRTYRIPKDDGSSPTRPTVGTKTFRVPTKRLSSTVDDRERSLSPSSYQTENGTKEHSPVPDHLKTEPLTSDGAKPDKGFYISFDDDAPIKPKPPLRTKKFTRKNSTPTTPVSTPSKEDFPLITDTPLRSTRTPSLDLPSPSSLYKRPSLFSPTSRASLSPSSPAAPLHPTNGFNYSSSANDSTAESSEDIQPAEVAGESSTGLALVIGSDLLHQPESQLSDMERKKQRLMINAMKRKQQQEELKRVKEMEAEQKREKEKEEEERKLKKKEDERQRRELILERHKIKKAIEEAEKEGRYYQPPAWYLVDQQQQQASSKSSSVKLRAKAGGGGSRPRPKTMHEGDSSDGSGGGRLMAARRNRGSTHNVAESGGGHSSGGPSSVRKSAGRWGSSHSLSRAAGSRGSTNSLSGDYSTTTTRTLDRRTNLHSGRRPSSMAPTSSSLSRHQSTKSLYGSRSRLADARDEDGPEHYRVHANPRRAGMGGGGGPEQHLVGGSTGLRRPSGGYRAPTAASNSRRYRSTGNLSGASEHDSLMYGMSEDSGLGRSTPPRRAASPGGSGGTAGGGAVGRHLPSPSQPGSLPPGLISRRRPNVHGFDDAASDISTTSSTMDFTGPRLYKQPASKSNRPIVLNAVEFCVFPGAVNESSKLRVMEEIARSGSKHFLFLFRDAGCQFRALYSFNIETEEVDKLYGTGPKRITEGMFDKFFKYNSGAKNFSQVHTKHITATIDAFTIHNSLWQGKKVSMHSKKDFALVI